MPKEVKEPRNMPIWEGESSVHLWFLLARTRDAIYRARQKDLYRSGVTEEQSVVLNIVQGLVSRGMADKVTLVKLSRWMHRRPHSVSELVDRMARDGIIAKVQDLKRRNMVRVELTKKGREQYKAAQESESLERIMSRLSTKEKRELRRLLRILREAALNDLGVVEVPPSLGKSRKKRISANRSDGRNGNG